MLCVDNLKPFANKPRLVEHPVPEVITAKIILVRIRQSLNDLFPLTFFKGELLGNFIERKNDNTNGFDNEHRVTAPSRRPGS
jgi:hypothetical protein